MLAYTPINNPSLSVWTGNSKWNVTFNTFPCSSATHVQNEDGSVVLLSAHNPRQRSAIAKKLLTPSKDSSFGGASKKVWLASRGGGRGGEGKVYHKQLVTLVSFPCKT